MKCIATEAATGAVSIKKKETFGSETETGGDETDLTVSSCNS